MRSFLKTLAMGAILLPSLGLAQTPAPTSSSDALVQARSKYSSSLAELVNALSVNCVSNIVTVVNCDRAFTNVAKNTEDANVLIGQATTLFTNPSPCQTIAARLNQLNGTITSVNEYLRDAACSSAPAVKAALLTVARRLRAAVSENIVDIQNLATIFAKNNRCNMKQTAPQLKAFANTVNIIVADDQKTARALTVNGQTLNCII